MSVITPGEWTPEVVLAILEKFVEGGGVIRRDPASEDGLLIQSTVEKTHNKTGPINGRGWLVDSFADGAQCLIESMGWLGAAQPLPQISCPHCRETQTLLDAEEVVEALRSREDAGTKD